MSPIIPFIVNGKVYLGGAPYIHEYPCSKPRDFTYNIASILRSDGRTLILANPWTRCSQNWLILRCLSKDYVFPLSRLQCVFAMATHEGWLLLKREASNSKTMKEIN
jgi:hypothetical protein